MNTNLGSTFSFAVLLISSVSADVPIIELPQDYNLEMSWDQLSSLGLQNLTQTDCLRECNIGDHRICMYTFTLEHYASMGTACGNCSSGVLKDCFRPQCIPGDGTERGVMSINRMIPGPEIHVCKGDLLMVNVRNMMGGTTASIHWHGILQKKSQWMDGVPYVTQCPIGCDTNFRYVFPVEEAGTMFYHSHSGHHKMNGHLGALIVRQPRPEEPWPSDLYDLDLPEHTVILSDWMHDYAEMFFPGLPTRHPGARPTTVLVNGLGIYESGKSRTRVPYKIFHVKTGNRYRFRIINAASMICPLQVQIQDHRMTVIATDGSPVKPITIDTLVTYGGERFDVVIDTDNVTDVRAYWIHVRGLGVCDFENHLHQHAVLSYNNEIGDYGITPKREPPTLKKGLPTGRILNHPNTTCPGSTNQICITDLELLRYDERKDILNAEPDVKLIIPFGFHFFDTDEFHREGYYHHFLNFGGMEARAGTMGDLSFRMPSTPTLFTRTGNPRFCHEGNLPDYCDSGINGSRVAYCECSHVVTLKKDDIIEMTLIDANTAITGINHPFHLHGHLFHVMRLGQDLSKPEGYTVPEVRSLLSRESLTKNRENPGVARPPLKDTVSVPSKGFAVLRWKADNPGDWLLHCHFEWHMAAGMMMAFRVIGEVKSPPPRFPTCGDFDPL